MCAPVIAGGDASEVFDSAEHPLDAFAVCVEAGREAIPKRHVVLGRDVGRGAAGFDLSADGIAVIALVAMQDGGLRHPVEQGIGGGTSCHLAAGPSADAREWKMSVHTPLAAQRTNRL